jgi:hypothetical protein
MLSQLSYAPEKPGNNENAAILYNRQEAMSKFKLRDICDLMNDYSVYLSISIKS